MLQEMPMRLRTFALAGSAAMLLTLPAIAHHSFAMFDQSQTTHLEGTVSDFEWINPHVWLHVSIAAEDGSEQVWSFEAGSTGQLTQSFWTPDSVAVGDQIVVADDPDEAVDELHVTEDDPIICFAVTPQ